MKIGFMRYPVTKIYFVEVTYYDHEKFVFSNNNGN